MTLIYLIQCSNCQKDTGIATINPNILEEISFTCDQCGQKGLGTDNYRTMEREKYLEGFEEVNSEEKEN
ncbi:hypothetical protein [endosymbiont GvMRE of Glomus versiforme]|uniref:hypothetical protein n=1 Tax=endosymbiont GvMRE of Glomus versiforme TaxID=2039283 RepID=UPI000EDAFB18|nr:hypothetical protein [endosymbiont GvMRE of Glomus versiforme]RHZ37432.1 hypothetical protein GvMRE_I1g557 [endosymbiont GvMRE of Glomus versiforme]